MAETIKGINVVISANTTALSKALASVDKASKSIQSELKQVDKLLKLDPKSTELLVQKQKLLKDAVSGSKDKLNQLKEAQKQVNEQFRQGKISEGQYRAFQRETIKTEQELKNLESQLKKTGGSFGNFSLVMKNAGEKMRSAGATLTKTVTAPLVGIGSAALLAARTYEGAVNKIRVGTGATGNTLKSLEKDFKAVFSNTSAGADVVATAIADLNTRTGATGNQLQILAARAVRLAKLTGGDVGPQIAAVTRVFGDWGVAAKDQAATMDLLFKVSQSTGVGVDDLAQKTVQFGAPLRQMGFKLLEATAILGKFEKEGVNTELVVGSLRIALGKMAKKGITDPSQALDTIIKQIKNAGSAGKANALALEFFGARAGPDMAAAIREGRFEVASLMKQLSTSGETILKAAADTRTFEGRITALKNKATVALVPLGMALMDTLEKAMPALEGALRIINTLSTAFAKMPPGLQKTILAFGLVLIALGPFLAGLGNLITIIPSVVIGFGRIIPAITAVRTAMMGLNFTAILSPIGLVIIAITALAAAAYLVIKNWSKIKAFFIGLWTSITSIFTGAGEKIKTLLAGVWESVKTKAAIVWESLKTFLVNWWPYLIGALAGPVGLLAAFIYKNWDNIKAGTLKIWDNIKTGISNALGTIKTTIVSGLEKAWAYIKSIPAESVNWGKDIIQGIIKGITQKFADLWKTIENIASGIKNRIKSALNIKSPSGIMEEFGRMVAEGLAQGIEESAPKVDKSAVGLTENLEAQFGKASKITGVSEGLLIAVGKIESGFNRLAKSSAGARGIMQIMPDTAAGLAKQLKIPTKNILTNSYENILAGATYLKQMMGMFDDNIQLALAAYNAGAGRVKSAIAKTGATAWDTVKKLLPKETQNYVDKVLGAMENLKTGYNNIVSNVKEANQKLVDAVKSAADTMINKFDLLGSITEKKFRILELTGGAVNIWDKFSAKKDLLTSQFSLIAKQVEVLTSAYNELAKVQGAGSTDALEMQNRLLDMQIKLLETKKELEAVSTQERRTKENTRLLEEAASIAGGKTVVNNVTVNNPKPETAGDSVRKELLRLQYMGALG